ncbi:MAG: pirin family protein [Flavobacteriales bacterium]
MEKSIKHIVPAEKVNMGGNLLDQPLPAGRLESLDPFLLIHHWKSELPGNQKQQDAGVGPHPHRGFSPVTFVFKGEVKHQDSLGNNALVKEGGTQWMFAGSGLTHSERFSKELVEKGGELEFIQFWVNTPGKQKMNPPFYRPLSKEETPVIKTDKAEVFVVSGELNGVNGAVETYSPQLLLRGEVKTGGKLSIPVPPSFNSLLYLLDGGLVSNGIELKAKDMVVFQQEEGNLVVEASEDTRFMMLAGEPIGEKIAQYGPFVMNNQTEVMQALRDAQMGKMGVLIEEFD